MPIENLRNPNAAIGQKLLAFLREKMAAPELITGLAEILAENQTLIAEISQRAGQRTIKPLNVLVKELDNEPGIQASMAKFNLAGVSSGPVEPLKRKD